MKKSAAKVSPKKSENEFLRRMVRQSVEAAELRSEARFGVVERKIDGVNARVGQVDGRLGKVETKLDGVALQVASLTEQVAENTAAIARVDAKVDRLEQRFDGLEQRFDGLEQRFDGLEGRFVSFQSDVARIMQQGFERIEAVLDRRLGPIEAAMVPARLDRIEKHLGLPPL